MYECTYGRVKRVHILLGAYLERTKVIIAVHRLT